MGYDSNRNGHHAQAALRILRASAELVADARQSARYHNSIVGAALSRRLHISRSDAEAATMAALIAIAGRV